MLARVVRWFATGPDRPQITDASLVRKIYERRRLRVLIWLVVGYGFFYTCRLSLSVAKKPMLDEGVATSNWIETVPGKGFFSYFRFYGVQEPLLERIWRPSDFQRVE